MQTNEDVDDTDDVPRYTVGLAEAEERLRLWIRRMPSNELWPNEAAHAADVELVLNELNGLKQFDPR